MKRLFRRSVAAGLVVVVVGAAVAVLASGATARSNANIQVCVLLPDTKSSVRWVQFDPKYIGAGTEEGRRHVLDQQRA